ncbi:MAG TPA: hypothetical protein VFB80_16015 [Pirellulaceae bacterium]|nr:hypothetical protein [Pirellulaceae bacterium]
MLKIASSGRAKMSSRAHELRSRAKVVSLVAANAGVSLRCWICTGAGGAGGAVGWPLQRGPRQGSGIAGRWSVGRPLLWAAARESDASEWSIPAPVKIT